MFDNRADAAVHLAEELHDFVGAENTVIVGIPAGGAVVGAEVAMALKLPFACVGIYKVPAPALPDVTYAVIDEDGEVTLDPKTEMTRHEVRKAGDSILDRLRADMARCHEGLPRPALKDMTVIVVDDAVFSDLPVKAAADYLRRQGATRLVLATPVMSLEARDVATTHFDYVYVLRTGRVTGDLAHYYRDAGMPTEDQVMASVRGAYAANAERM